MAVSNRVRAHDDVRRDRQSRLARRARARLRTSTVASYAGLCVCAAIVGFPLFWMLTGAFKPEAEIQGIPATILPVHGTVDNFGQLFGAFNFGPYFWNSTWLAVVRAGMPAVTSALCGYVLAKIPFRGRGIVFLGVLATMLLPGAITLIPSYILMFRLGWIGTYWPLIVPSVFSPYAIFLMRQLMQRLPDETLDAARIDGASEWGLFRRIALPSMTPGIAAVFILTFIWAWDDFVWPLMVLNDQSMYTLPIGLASFTLQHYTLFGPLLAGSVVTTIPVIVVFYLGQRQIVDSGLFAGLKL